MNAFYAMYAAADEIVDVEGTWDKVMGIISWLVIAGGIVTLIVGAVTLMSSFGENASGTDRMRGVLTVIGGVALIAIGAGAEALFPPPPTFS
jgi:hypothetical protein